VTIVESILWPLTPLYGAAVRLRVLAYAGGILREQRLAGVVISVGNITVGGTGKTPMVLWIAQRLVAEGKNTGILTRGYRGEAASAGVGSPNTEQFGTESTLDSTSDEVQILRARLGGSVRLGVGADRFARGCELAKQGVRWFVLDDGFQHLQLARDVDIVLIDASNPFGGRHLLPAGRLREPRSALARADIIVITRGRHCPGLEAAIRRDSSAPIFYARTQLDSISKKHGVLNASDAGLEGKKVFAFCGIGNPAAFVSDLREWGFQVVGHKFFRDHHRYTQQNVCQMEDEAGKSGAEALICTEKDLFNLDDVQCKAFDVVSCRISMRVDREEEFWREILSRAESRQRQMPSPVPAS
jgi:tetraacyldisaccharide 4'-kinase